MVIFIICMISAKEWNKLSGLSSYKQHVCIMILYSLLLLLIGSTVFIYQSISEIFIIRCILLISLIWWTVTLFLIIYYPYSAIFWKNSNKLKLIFGMLAIIPFFCGMLSLRQHHYTEDNFIGSLWIFYVILLVWSIDSGAYIFGYILGRHKLIPNVSPNKTWEGLIGGLFISMLFAYLFNKYVSLNIKYFTLIICSLITMLSSILGDLTESMLKREAGMKDSGNLIPGHGGILDRIDSLIAAIPIFSCLILLIFDII